LMFLELNIPKTYITPKHGKLSCSHRRLEKANHLAS